MTVEMADFLVNTFFLIICLLIYCIYKIIEYKKSATLRELIAWCVTINDNIYRCNLRLRDYILKAQNHLQIPEEYRIKGEEWDYVNIIIEKYQRDLTEAYFSGRALIIKSKYVISGETYFIFSLSNYLEDHQCDSKFLTFDMHKEKLSYKSYGSWGAPLYDAEYSLTDFAYVYHKLFYISLLYCQNSKVINPKGTEYWPCPNVKEILDRKTIKMGRY